MISRRNIRVKVMQELYAQSSGESVEKNNPVANLQKQLEQTKQLFFYLNELMIAPAGMLSLPLVLKRPATWRIW